MARDIISPLSCVRSYLSIRAVYTIRHTWDFQKPSLLSDPAIFFSPSAVSFLKSFVTEQITWSLAIFIGHYIRSTGIPVNYSSHIYTRTYTKWFSSLFSDERSGIYCALFVMCRRKSTLPDSGA